MVNTPSFFRRIRGFIGSLLFRLYLFVEGLTREQYFNMMSEPSPEFNYRWICGSCGAPADYFIVGDVEYHGPDSDYISSNKSGEHG